MTITIPGALYNEQLYAFYEFKVTEDGKYQHIKLGFIIDDLVEVGPYDTIEQGFVEVPVVEIYANTKLLYNINDKVVKKHEIDSELLTIVDIKEIKEEPSGPRLLYGSMLNRLIWKSEKPSSDTWCIVSSIKRLYVLSNGEELEEAFLVRVNVH
jgi:hypothetical protein